MTAQIREARALLIHVDTGAVLSPGSPLVLEDADGTGSVWTFKGIAERPSEPSGLGGRIRIAPPCQHRERDLSRCCERHWREIHPSYVGARIDKQ